MIQQQNSMLFIGVLLMVSSTRTATFGFQMSPRIQGQCQGQVINLRSRTKIEQTISTGLFDPTPAISLQNLLEPEHAKNGCLKGITSGTSNRSPSASTTKLQMANADNESTSTSTSTSDLESSSLLDKPILAAIDFASLVIFAGVGKASHSADGSLDIQGVFTTAFPFLAAWFATSPLTGVYRNTNSGDGDNDGGGILEAGKLAAKGWIVAIPLGCVLRGVIKGYVPPLPFVIVTMIVTLVILGGTRMIYSLVEDKLE